jgi:hypothetical protein
MPSFAPTPQQSANSAAQASQPSRRALPPRKTARYARPDGAARVVQNATYNAAVPTAQITAQLAVLLGSLVSTAQHRRLGIHSTCHRWARFEEWILSRQKLLRRLARLLLHNGELRIAQEDPVCAGSGCSMN